MLILFLSAEKESEAEDCLNRLFKEYLTPQIRNVLASYLTLLSEEKADGALTKNALVKAILEITEAARFEEAEMPEGMSEYLSQSENDELVANRQADYLRRIWDEVKTFPAHQRKVLLLSLKESRDVEAITLFLQKGVATIKEIADALEVSREKIFEIFARLPLSSREIAEFLGIKDKGKTSK